MAKAALNSAKLISPSPSLSATAKKAAASIFLTAAEISAGLTFPLLSASMALKAFSQASSAKTANSLASISPDPSASATLKAASALAVSEWPILARHALNSAQSMLPDPSASKCLKTVSQVIL